MNRCQPLFALVFSIALALVACAPATPRTAEPSAPSEPGASAAADRELVILARGEPPSFAARAFQSAGGTSNSYAVFNATLDDVDEGGTPAPVLADALPQLNTDTWRVFPDGRMQTTYRLKSGLVYHDGTALEAEDFVFAWRVYATPQLGTSGTLPVGVMEEVSASDSQTLVIRWRRPFPGAAILGARTQTQGFQALPRHVLEQPYRQGDYDALANHPFWTREYIGLGPYRLQSWEPGTSVDGVAFDRFVLGRPKISRVHIMFMTDPNAAVASLLSGEGHIGMDYLVMYEHGATLERQWAGTNGGNVLFSPLLVRISVFQLRPETIATPAIMDVRFRRALTHAMDRAALNQAFYGGQAILTDGFLSPRLPYYAAVEPALTRYPYDPRRAQQLVEEMGLQRGAGGLYLGPDRQPFSFEVMLLQNPTQEAENAVIVEGYQRLGVNAVGRVLPVAQFNDGQVRASYSGMLTTGAAGFERDLSRYTTGQISRPETRWQGTNYGAYINDAYDRLWEAYNTTLDPTVQIQQLAQMETIISQELPQIPMFYTPLVTPHVAPLVGPVVRTSRDADNLVRLHEWHWRA